jgi:chromosome segregation protein
MNKKEDAARRINAMRSNMRSFEEELDGLKQQAYQQQLNGQELSYGEKGIIDRLTQTYKIDINNVPEEVTQQDLGGLSADSEEFVQTLEELRKQCDSFGSVNLVAIEEYEELKQRFEFLTKQQVDLLEAKSHLMNTIQKINRSTRQMFMETFTKVSEEFRIYFRMLFGGGDAELILLDPENVLESGIDIIARPPGKKLQNISLLSGGEKTLTAIALIFGVFKVNPSPFCVLDEIDAALDESNVGRFSFLLKEFANISQFIVITHNKKTMSGSNVMYGVTMPETGISRVVSVKFLNEEDKKDKPLEMVGAEA